MAQIPFDNSSLLNIKTFDELVYRARVTDLSDLVDLFTRSGFNEDVDAGVKEDIWIPGGTKVDTGTAGVVEVLSSSANDTSNGTGARTVRLFGLDASYNLVTADVTLNGTTAVETTQQFIDIYRAHVLTAGSGAYNAGLITVRLKTGAVTLNQMRIGSNVAMGSHFTIPAGYTGFLLGISLGMGGADRQSGIINIESKVFGSVWRTVFTGHFPGESGPLTSESIAKTPLPERTSIKATVVSDANNGRAQAVFDILTIKNDYL
jgi:hypothetical protein